MSGHIVPSHWVRSDILIFMKPLDLCFTLMNNNETLIFT